MKPVPGMKLDLRNSKKSGIFSIVCRAGVLAVGLSFVVDASWSAEIGLVDPTRPSYVGMSSRAKEAAARGPRLQSTFVSSSERRAVINGRTYQVGDKFGGGVITDIRPYEVVLTRARRESRLRLLPKLAKETSIVKVPANSQEGRQK